MIIRNYEAEDCEKMIKLFYETVHFINSKDYKKEQLAAWAPKEIDKDSWNKTFIENYTLVATIDGDIVGFGDVRLDGYVNKLFVHKDNQKLGVAKEIVMKLEIHAKNSGIDVITTEASITAKPFFQSQGYTVVKEQLVERNGQHFINYLMRKYI